MSALKYKTGDKVRIKSIDWYNKNKDSNGNVTVLSKVPHFSWCETVRTVFTKDMAKFCGKVVTIESVWSVNYTIVEGTYIDGINIDYFTDEMIEGLVDEEEEMKKSEATVEPSMVNLDDVCKWIQKNMKKYVKHKTSRGEDGEIEFTIISHSVDMVRDLRKAMEK